MSAAESKSTKKTLHRLHEKYCKNGQPRKDIRIAIADKANAILAKKGPSRNDLMLKVKARGIKLFRIMNKAELAEALTAKLERIAEIQLQAKTRWQAGWGKGEAKKTQPEVISATKTPIVEANARKEGAI